ncbi:MAG TPA: hypothetical protein VMH86_00235 [Rhizomicrobium sp.]|nr:hypothetical protein [Rhizomicrobium sp.]
MITYLSPAAWVILLQTTGTYASIYSAYCFAIPVIRMQNLEFTRDTLANVEAKDSRATAIFKKALDSVSDEIEKAKPTYIRRNLRGYVWLFLSLALFLGAMVLQLATDPAFRHPG